MILNMGKEIHYAEELKDNMQAALNHMWHFVGNLALSRSYFGSHLVDLLPVASMSIRNDPKVSSIGKIIQNSGSWEIDLYKVILAEEWG